MSKFLVSATVRRLALVALGAAVYAVADAFGVGHAVRELGCAIGLGCV